MTREQLATDRCDICGELIVVDATPVTVSGWYGGRYFRWDNGFCKLLRVRCEAHPYDELSEDLAMSEEEGE